MLEEGETVKQMRSVFFLWLFFVSTILLFEVAFKMRFLHADLASFFTIDGLRSFLFDLFYASVATVFAIIFKAKANRYFFVFFTLLVITIYFSQDIYFLVSGGNFYSFAVTGDLLMGLTFYYRLLQSLAWFHLIYFLPLILLIAIIILEKKGKLDLFTRTKKPYKQAFVILSIGFFAFFSATLTINTGKDDNQFAYSDYDLYVEPIVPHTAMRKFGVITYATMDLSNAIKARENKSITDDTIYEYFNNKPEHQDNDMSGVFEDKNLILILAESLDTYAINPYFTPNLYKISQTGWSFDNYYAPLYFRNTADTEFMVHTGYYPNRHVQLSMNRYEENYFPNTLPRLFSQEDYDTASFHNFSDYFYPRETFHPNTLGFNRFYGPDALGLITPSNEERGDITGHYWHSDLAMFENGLDYIIGSEPFFGYFLTVSGHMPYESIRHDIVHKNYPIIEQIIIDNDLGEIPEQFINYHAAQWELDLAIGYLLDTLEERQLLDDTVIVIFGDHYAYGISQEEIFKYAPDKQTDKPVDIHKIPLMMYHGGMTPQTFHETFSSIDIIPTLANLFNLDLDYSLLMGEDAFSDTLNQVVFANVSFLTNDYAYMVEHDHFISNDEYTEQEIRLLLGKTLFYNQLNYYILDTDFFNPERDILTLGPRSYVFS